MFFVGGKRGEQKQAVGRSPGGRNTKIHAPADVKGRLIAILLTTGEAHDCPVAERLVRRVRPSKRMLGDKAYDSAELGPARNQQLTPLRQFRDNADTSPQTRGARFATS
jgi:Transposase DDE domain